mgnify:CR=1 FL=1
MSNNDITGKRYGMLTVLSRDGMDKSRRNAMWLCRCDCGKSIRTTTSHLKCGHTTSCGCRKSEFGKATRFKKTHGLSYSRLYRILRGMKNRCYNPNDPKYYLYGGRGIKICDEWLDDVKSFYDWAMSHGYDDKLTIDRINCDGDYTPFNCRWATILEQNRNRRNVKGGKD